MNADEEFQKWLASEGSFDAPEETVPVARRAFDAALSAAARTARDQAKRYGCAKCRGICNGIADQIKKQEAP